MKAVLVYNPNSRNTDDVPAEQLVRWLKEGGYDIEYEQTCEESDLDPILQQDLDLVVAAGGDGTLRAVATRLVGRKTALAPIPMGTANNIAASLGISGTPEEIIAGLRDPIKRPYDLGCVRTPFNSTYFLEAFGFGVYATGLAHYQPEEGKSVLRSLTAIAETLAGFQPEYCKLTLDGEDISGNYLLVTLMNTSAFGPRLKFAPRANPGDGLLDAIRIREDGRDNLIEYVASLLNETLQELPSVETTRGRKLEMVWSGAFPLHADAEVIPAVREPDEPGLFPVTVEVLPAELEVWLLRSKVQTNSTD